MHRTCIAVIDATRARLFTLDRIANEIGLHEEISEKRDLVNPGRRLRATDMFADTRPGLGRSGELQYGLDDHRESHVDGLDVEFSKQITKELVELLREVAAQRLIICAGPRMLGHVRDAMPRLDIPCDEVPRDFAKLTPTEIRSHLVTYGLLQQPPPHERALR